MSGFSANCSVCVLQAPRRSHATLLLNTLHWLPVQQRIDYKVDLLTFKIRSTSTPSYLDPSPTPGQRGRPQSATTIGHSGAVPTVHQDNNRKARFPLHSTSHLELAAKDSSAGQ